MDKVANYKKAVRKVVEEIAGMVPSDEKVETQLIMDDERGHYLCFSVGWENGDYREHSVFLHIDVKSDGKVWVQHDGTDLKVALLLVDEGIPKSDIVLGFRAPVRRMDVPEFATA